MSAPSESSPSTAANGIDLSTNHCASTRATTVLPTPPFSPPMKWMRLMRGFVRAGDRARQDQSAWWEAEGDLVSRLFRDLTGSASQGLVTRFSTWREIVSVDQKRFLFLVQQTPLLCARGQADHGQSLAGHEPVERLTRSPDGSARLGPE